MDNHSFILKIFRGHPGNQYWEEFELKRAVSMNIISALMEIQKNPVTREGKTVEPVVWESACLEEVCGSCSMLINAIPRQACTALVEKLISETGKEVITLAPLTKFPLIRDLIVDRSQMFENLKKIHGWIDIGSTFNNDHCGPKIHPEKQQIMYALSTCMTCGCCSEACPQINSKSSFIGPAAISQARFYNDNPTGKTQMPQRLHVLMEEGGVSSCGNAQNCVKVCPKEIPLTDSIAALSRDVTLQFFRNLLSLPDRDSE